MNERVKQWIIEAHRRGESLDAIRIQVRNTFDTDLTFWAIQEVCNEADSGMNCVCGYTGDDFTRLMFSARSDSGRETVYACPKCGTLRIEL
jgi:hypothetical protein